MKPVNPVMFPNRRCNGFPGNHAGASLKRRAPAGLAVPVGLGFPGNHAGASLKRGVMVDEFVHPVLFPR